MTGRLLGTENNVTYRRYEKVVQMGIQSFDEISPWPMSYTMTAGAGPVSASPSWPTIGTFRIDAVIVANEDAIDHVVMMHYNTENGGCQVGSMNVPARTGWDGTPALDFLAGIFPANQPVLYADNDISPTITTVETIVSGVVDVTMFAGRVA